MNMGLGGRAALAVTMCLCASACTRGNPAFGDEAEGSEGEGGTSNASVTGGTTGTSTSGASTSVDDGTGESGGAGSCGDGVVDSGEQCDKGADENSNVGPCKLDCSYNVCGDGFVGPGEACDDPDDVNEELCRQDCTLPTCGNGVVDRMEVCDPTADVGGVDGCTPICTHNVCGDMFPLGKEECDDGNLETNDGCIDCVAAFCGDGFVREGDEECDGDVPRGVTCTDLEFFAGEPSCDTMTCLISAEGCHNCGDGTVQENEQCDPADPNGPAPDPASCANTPGWMGPGMVFCAEGCFIGVENGCCKVDGQPCSADNGTNVFCCSQFCDQMSGTCGG